MKYSQTMARASPPFSPMLNSRFELDQSPVMYGKNISTNAGISSRPPVT